MLAAALASGLEFRTLTIAYPITKRRDIVLPPGIAALAGVPHSVKRLAPANTTEIELRFSEVSRHMDGAAFHPAWYYYASTYDELMNDPERVLIASNCFEIGRCSFWHKFANIGLADAPPSVDQLISAFAYRSSWRPEPQAVWRRHSKAGSTHLRTPCQSFPIGATALILISAAVAGTQIWRTDTIYSRPPDFAHQVVCGSCTCCCSSRRPSGARALHREKRFA